LEHRVFFSNEECLLDSQAMTEIFPYLFQIEIYTRDGGGMGRLVQFSIAWKQETGCPFFSADELRCLQLQVVHTFLQVVVVASIHFKERF
jgi:hypothetical protein